MKAPTFTVRRSCSSDRPSMTIFWDSFCSWPCSVTYKSQWVTVIPFRCMLWPVYWNCIQVHLKHGSLGGLSQIVPDMSRLHNRAECRSACLPDKSNSTLTFDFTNSHHHIQRLREDCVNGSISMPHSPAAAAATPIVSAR